MTPADDFPDQINEAIRIYESMPKSRKASLLHAMGVEINLLPKPIPMTLTCPVCCGRHIDKGEFATKPHHTHACQHCGLTWRPAIVNTVGVQFLPGFKDESNEQ